MNRILHPLAKPKSPTLCTTIQYEGWGIRTFELVRGRKLTEICPRRAFPWDYSPSGSFDKRIGRPSPLPSRIWFSSSTSCRNLLRSCSTAIEAQSSRIRSLSALFIGKKYATASATTGMFDDEHYIGLSRATVISAWGYGSEPDSSEGTKPNSGFRGSRIPSWHARARPNSSGLVLGEIWNERNHAHNYRLFRVDKERPDEGAREQNACCDKERSNPEPPLNQRSKNNRR
jgi:hypothetical protein